MVYQIFVGAFGNISTFYQNQRLLQQTPPPLSTLAKPDIEGAQLLIESASRGALQATLHAWQPELRALKGVLRWNVEVDPLDI